MATVNDVIENVLLKLREETTGSDYWSTTELIDYVNDGIRFMAIDGELFFKTSTLRGVSGQSEYQMPTNMVALKRLEYDSELILHSNAEEWDAINDAWQTESGTPREYSLTFIDGYMRPYPYPGSSGSTAGFDAEYGGVTDGDTGDTFDAEYGTLTDLGDSGDSEYGLPLDVDEADNNFKLFYTYIPDDLTGTDELPYQLSKDPSVIEYYVVWQCYDKEGETQDAQRGQYYGQKFNQRYHFLKRRDELPRSPTIVGRSSYPSKRRRLTYPNLPDNYPR